MRSPRWLETAAWLTLFVCASIADRAWWQAGACGLGAVFCLVMDTVNRNSK